MSDQATELRRLVRTTGSTSPAKPGPRTIVVSGGRPGVGATTLTIQLAASLAGDAQRVVLIDADLYRADIAARCGLARGLDIGDVLSGRQSIHEALRLGP